eukprot:jgi/Ulvmu1/5627/UM023_0166.1
MFVHVQILGGHGLVWDADGVVQLRMEHRVVGSMVGSIAEFKQQNSIRGLPLRLSPMEVTVLLLQGCIKLYGIDESNKMKSLPGAVDEGVSSDDESLSEQWTGLDIPKWKAVLAAKSVLSVQDVHAETSRSAVKWTFPCTQHEQQRHAVFADLYFKRYFLTDGIKFGGDFLAYEGDPETCHAAFTVLVTPGGYLADDALGAACRAATAARKKLLVANPVCEDGEWIVDYTTVFFESQK